MPARILHIEDNPGDRLLMLRKIEASSREWKVDGVGSLAEGLSAANPDLVLLDLGLPDSEGLEGLSRLRLARPTTPIVVLTGSRQDEVALLAIREGADDFISKEDLTASKLLRTVDLSLERRRIRVDLAETKNNFTAIIQATPDPIWVVSPQGQVHFANLAARRLLGDGATPWSPDIRQDTVHKLKERDFQLRISESLWFGEPCLLLMAYDVTTSLERHAEMAELRKTISANERQLHLQRLSNGLNSSLNNALVSVLKVAARVDPINAAELTEASRRIRGVANLVGTFSDERAKLASPNDLRGLLRRIRSTLSQRSDQIELDFQLDQGVRDAYFSSGYLQPILISLMDNAIVAGCRKVWIRAYPEGEHVRLEWESRYHPHDSPAWRAARWDSLGSGPDALALTAARAFALGAKGSAELQLSTRPGEVHLRLSLPVARPRPLTAPVRAASTPSTRPEGGLRCMVVSSEPWSRGLMAKELRNRQHEVLEARSIREALLVTLARPLDVLIYDLIGPGSDASLLTQRLREEGSLIPVLLLSDNEGKDLPNSPGVQHLQKPFHSRNLEIALQALVQAQLF